MKRSVLPALVFSVLSLGIADSMVGPYLVLYGTGEAHLSPLQVGVFMSLISVSGLVVSTWLGRRYDRSASRWPAFVAIIAPAVGYLALTTTTSYPMLLLIAVGLLGAGMAAFPQFFALARTHLDHTGGAASRRGTPVLRSVWSVAWAVGPMIGAGLLASGGYGRLLVVTALAFLVVGVPLLLIGRTPRASHADGARPDKGRLTRPMVLAVGGFTFFHTAMLSGSVVLPLYVTDTLHRSDSSVGLLFTVCALVEIPVALATMLLPGAVRQKAIVAGMVLLGAYFVAVAMSTTMPLLIGTQVARGVALATVSALGITYVQDLAPQAPGRATTLFANTLTFGSLVSGVLAGATAQAFGYRWTLLLCAALAVAGFLLVALVRQSAAAVPEGAVPAGARD